MFVEKRLPAIFSKKNLSRVFFLLLLTIKLYRISILFLEEKKEKKLAYCRSSINILQRWLFCPFCGSFFIYLQIRLSWPGFILKLENHRILVHRIFKQDLIELKCFGIFFVQRISVPDEKVPWNVNWPDYKPTEYTAPAVLKNPPWADNPDP